MSKFENVEAYIKKAKEMGFHNTFISYMYKHAEAVGFDEDALETNHLKKVDDFIGELERDGVRMEGVPA